MDSMTHNDSKVIQAMLAKDIFMRRLFLRFKKINTLRNRRVRYWELEFKGYNQKPNLNWRRMKDQKDDTQNLKWIRGRREINHDIQKLGELSSYGYDWRKSNLIEGNLYNDY